jgi:hypothetical protein
MEWNKRAALSIHLVEEMQGDEDDIGRASAIVLLLGNRARKRDNEEGAMSWPKR